MIAPNITIGRVGAYVTVRFTGDLDIANVEQVRSHVLAAVPIDAHGLVVDLSTTRYIDSAGVHMLFELVRKLETRRQALAIAVPEDSPIATLLKITNAAEAAPVCATVDECVNVLRDDMGGY